MKRNVSLEEISDGRLYQRQDMARVGCGGCRGCSVCCRGMGQSIVLDPYDVWRLCAGLSVCFSALLEQGRVELGVVDGIILPNLKMNERTDSCSFLDENGRCSVHAFRPGICRMFPLGRYYEKDSFCYFLQVHECPKTGRTKERISRWLDTPQLPRYEAYITSWHYFLESLEEKLPLLSEEGRKNASLYLLKLFFMKPYEPDDFYPQFEERLEAAADVLEIPVQNGENYEV